MSETHEAMAQRLLAEAKSSVTPGMRGLLTGAAEEIVRQAARAAQAERERDEARVEIQLAHGALSVAEVPEVVHYPLPEHMWPKPPALQEDEEPVYSPLNQRIAVLSGRIGGRHP